MSFCKHFRTGVPQRLEIPESLFRDSMNEHVVLEYQGEMKQFNVEAGEDSKHYIASWGDFVAKNKITIGCVVCFTIMNDNHLFVESFSTTRGSRTRRPRQPAVRHDMTEAVVENFTKAIYKQRSCSPENSRDAGKGSAAFYVDGKLENYVPGTEAAFRKASTLQKSVLSSSCSVIMVMPALSGLISSAGLEFKREFAEEYCTWNVGDIQLKDTREKVWTVEWEGSKLGSDFIGFYAAHKLNRGDVCIFVVQLSGFQVHIFKAEVPKKRALLPPPPLGEISDQDSKYHRDVVDDDSSPRPPRFNVHDIDDMPRPTAYQTPLRACGGGRMAGATAAEPPEGSHEFRISFRKDSSGKYKPHIIAELALEQTQYSKLSFESPKDLLQSLLG